MTDNKKTTFRVISVFEIIFAVASSLSWSGGYILQEFIHTNPTTLLHDITEFLLEFYFIGFPLALVFSFILISINSDKKIMPAKPLVLLCICPFVFAAGMYTMIIFQSKLLFLLGSLIISVGNILIQIYFITELKKSKNYIPPIEASQTADNKKRKLFKGLAAINGALILLTTASFLIPSWLELYDVINLSDSTVPLTVFMALGIIFSSILLNENVKETLLPIGTVNSAFAFNFLFPMIVWISHEIGFELEFTGPDYTPEVITGSVPIKICSVIFSIIAITISAALFHSIVKMNSEVRYSVLSHKKSSLWTLYVLNIFPATIFFASIFNDGLNEIAWGTEHYRFKIYDTSAYKQIKEFLREINFYTDTESFYIRMMICGLLVIIAYALITNIGKKAVFSKGQNLFIFSPYILGFIMYLVPMFFGNSFLSDDIFDITFGVITTIHSLLFLSTQIFILVKLIKFSKTKELA